MIVAQKILQVYLTILETVLHLEFCPFFVISTILNTTKLPQFSITFLYLFFVCVFTQISDLLENILIIILCCFFFVSHLTSVTLVLHLKQMFKVCSVAKWQQCMSSLKLSVPRLLVPYIDQGLGTRLVVTGSDDIDLLQKMSFPHH